MKPFSTSRLLLLTLLLPLTAWAQRFDTPLSHGIDAREVEYFETHPFVSPATRGETTPPDFDGLRTMAEWEEIEILCVGWEGYSAIEKQIVVNAAEECHVLILTESPNEVESYLTSNNNGGPAASLDNITIIDTPMNTVWIRDYGPNTVYGTGVDDRIIVDWLYNRPRPDDDVAPQVIRNHRRALRPHEYGRQLHERRIRYGLRFGAHRGGERRRQHLVGHPVPRPE